MWTNSNRLARALRCGAFGARGLSAAFAFAWPSNPARATMPNPAEADFRVCRREIGNMGDPCGWVKSDSALPNKPEFAAAEQCLGQGHPRRCLRVLRPHYVRVHFFGGLVSLVRVGV